MESDCEDLGVNSHQLKTEAATSTSVDIVAMLSAISNQMLVGQQELQKQNAQLASELQKVIADADQFKQEIRAELLSVQNSGSTLSSSHPPSSLPLLPAGQGGTVFGSISSPSAVPPVSSMMGSISSSDPPSGDFQKQLLTMLNNTFAQLTTVINDTKTVLGDKGSDTKMEWPKFSGDTKKFRAWYLGIMSQIAISPWKDLYDQSSNNVVKHTTNTTLNGKLYAKIISALEGQAFQHMVARPHIRGNGILLLQELHQMYKPRCVPEVIATKTAEFWGSTKRQPYETVDDYYNRFQELLSDFEDAEEPIPKKSAIRHFLFTLGSEFEPLQHNFRLGSIADEWKTQDWPTLLVLCRDFYSSVNPKGPLKRTRDSDSDRMSEAERSAHHKKVRNWFMNPSRFKSELEAEQKKHPGKCVYHLSKTHSTDTCAVKKECERLLASRSNSQTASSPPSSSTGQLRHLTEETFEDALVYPIDDSTEEVSNGTNEDSLHYFSHLSNHYL
jgi:hypothetical protein